ncbi:MAG: hypothetical protein IJU07_04775 [Synergistaceae bacterium]|nr:hypothetical protein [Synergistaceae bacterium]
MSTSKKKDDKTELIIAEGLAATQSARTSANMAAERFAKPENYTGNRTLYDSGSAKYHAKSDLFNGNTEVRDPYTGDVLTLRIKDAKAQFGPEWQKHLAEADHIQPLEKIYEAHKDNPFLTNDDIREAANSPGNIEVTSRSFNNAKRQRTNERFIGEREYRESKGIKLSGEAEREAVIRGKKAQAEIDSELRIRTVRNAASTFHNAGLEGAKQSGLTALTMSGIMNAAAVIKGEKEVGEAVADTLKTGGAGAVTGYLMSGGLTTLAQGLSKSSSALLQSLAKSNLPGQIVTAVMTFGGTLKRYASGEINTEDFILELGDKGTGLAAGGYGFVTGQALIPIPIVGGVIGSMVGYMLASSFYGELVGFLSVNEAKLAHEERLRIERECRKAIEMLREYRAEMEAVISRYLSEHITAFHTAFDTMKEALGIGDIDGFISGANMITEKLGGRVQFRNMREFDSLMMSEEAFVL